MVRGVHTGHGQFVFCSSGQRQFLILCPGPLMVLDPLRRIISITCILPPMTLPLAHTCAFLLPLAVAHTNILLLIEIKFISIPPCILIRIGWLQMSRSTPLTRRRSRTSPKQWITLWDRGDLRLSRAYRPIPMEMETTVDEKMIEGRIDRGAHLLVNVASILEAMNGQQRRCGNRKVILFLSIRAFFSPYYWDSQQNS